MSGPVNLPVEIGGARYSLIFKFGTMRLVEAELGQSMFDVMAAGEVGANALSAIFWAALQPKHRMVREASDDLIDAAGVVQIGAWIGEGLGQYFGEAEEPSLDEALDDRGTEGNGPKPRGRRPKATS